MGGRVVSQWITLPGDLHTLHSATPIRGDPGSKLGLFPDAGGIEMTISTVAHGDRGVGFLLFDYQTSSLSPNCRASQEKTPIFPMPDLVSGLFSHL